MSKKFKFLGLVLMALLLVVGVGAGTANAALTLDALTITSSGALTLEGAAASAITVGALNTGGISIGGGNTAKTINLGTGTAIDTINIGTGATGVDVIRIGQAAADLALTDANWSITTAGLITTADDLAVNGDDVTADGDLTVTGATGANVVATTGTLDLTSSASAVTITATGATAGDVTVTVGDDFTVNGVATSVYGIGTGNVAQTLNLGTGTDIDTINIGTGATGVDVIRIGQAAADLALTDANWSITTAGLFTTASNISVTDGEVGATKSRATDATGSFQPIWGDLTYVGAAGGTSTYHAGVMGNFMGDTLSNAGSDIHAGVVGKYSVTTSDALTGAKAGLVGEVETSVGDAAVMAVLGGDTSAITPGAAYGVVYLNSTAGSHFNYGLDLYHAATTDYGAPSAVDYGTADIRLSSGVKISTGLIAAIPATCTAGDIYIATDGGDDGIIRACEATDDWDSVGTPAD